MKQLLTTLLIAGILSCRGNAPIPPTPQTATFESFIGRYLIMDSVRTTINGISTLDVAGKGKGLDIVYSANGTYQVYHNPPTIKNYKYQSPDIIYYWTPPGSMQADQYTKILSINGNHIISTDTELNPNKKIKYYQTAE